ncbi:cysteine hydrolase [Candidatus Woesearchaeota archaeon]|nr:cysteine hydrolase [Candidatus Woesearchaeota archaeon]
MKPAVLVVDMQEYFLSALLRGTRKILVSSQLQVLEYCVREGIQVIFLEHEYHERTTRELNAKSRQIKIFERIRKPGNNGFVGTNLESVLDQFEADILCLMGVNASYCVKQTARSAIRKGFSILTSTDLIADARYYLPKNMSLDFYRKKGVLFDAHQDLISYLEALR